jgi:glycine betaine/proline transport system substrate-binding protein
MVFARTIGVICLLATSLLAAPAAAQKCDLDRPIRFAGNDWASNRFHVAVAQVILEKGWSCRTVVVPGTTRPLLEALARGDVDVNMELWKANNRRLWAGMVKAGQVTETKGVTIQGAVQGWFVPRYVIEGDFSRGILPMAPGLKNVRDLPNYKSLFTDPEQPSKGRFYNCRLGWSCERMNTKKLRAYRLAAHYTNYLPESGPALARAIAAAYRRGAPIVAYYWGPTWVLGAYDLVMLKEPAYDAALWNRLDRARSGQGMQAVAYPQVKVTVAVNTGFAAKAPTVMAFLNKYRMKDRQVSAALARMRRTGDSSGRQTALTFLKKHPEIWTRWLPAGVAKRVQSQL